MGRATCTTSRTTIAHEHWSMTRWMFEPEPVGPLVDEPIVLLQHVDLATTEENAQLAGAVSGGDRYWPGLPHRRSVRVPRLCAWWSMRTAVVAFSERRYLPVSHTALDGLRRRWHRCRSGSILKSTTKTREPIR